MNRNETHSRVVDNLARGAASVKIPHCRLLWAFLTLGFFLHGAFARGDCFPPPYGLVSWWRAETNAWDQEGVNNGAVVNAVGFTEGEVGQAFEFNGANYIAIPNDPSLDGLQQVTIEFWMNAASNNTIGTSYEGLVTSDFYGIEISTIAPRIGIQMFASADGQTFTHTSDINGGGAVLPSGQWHHVAGTFNGGELQLYIDGQPFGAPAPMSGQIAPMAPGSFLTIGSEDGRRYCVSCTAGRDFVGLIDEVAIYNRALSADEIAQLYYAGAAGKCVTTNSPAITVPPTDESVTVGQSALFRVAATGTAPLGYQWLFNGDAIAGATGAALTLTNLQIGQSGTYTVVVTNSASPAASASANLVVNPPPPCSPAPPNIDGWWRAEGNAQDQVGGNNGTNAGGVFYASGLSGQAFSFYGTNGSVVMADSPTLRLTNQMTIEAWINTRTLAGNQAIVSKMGGAAGNYGYQLVLSQGALIGQFNSPGQAWPQFRVSYNSPIAAGQWYHVAWTYDQSDMRLYINGSDVADSSTGPAPIATTIANLRISGDDNNQTYFNGQIDEVAVYDRALSSTEIAAIYNAGSSGKCPPSLPPAIVVQPGNQFGTTGGTAALKPIISGTIPLSYQWYFNSVPLPAGTNAFLVFPSLQLAQSGNYFVSASNPYGAVTSAVATLTVTNPPPSVRVPSTNVVAASMLALPVLVSASGTENALSFSLSFDATKLQFKGVTVGAGAPGGTLLVNTSSLSSGRLGLSIAMPPAATLNAGTQQVATLMLLVSNVPTTTTSITFGDVPTARELTDASLGIISSTYANGTLTITAATAFEGDSFPRPTGDRNLTVQDWLQIGRYVARLDYPTNSAEFQRADCAPRGTLGDGSIRVTDWVQSGRYLSGLDLMMSAGGPTNELSVQGAEASSARFVTIGQAGFVPGHAISIPITVTAQGNENALAMSFSFDPARLTFLGASLGTDAGTAALYMNAAQAGTGQVGFALALPPGVSLPAGARELIRLSFASSGTGSVSINSSDLPVPREISDVNASALPVSYVSGFVSAPSSPIITISRAGPNVVLSWPAWGSNYLLQAQPAPVSAHSWTNVNVTPLINGNQESVTLPLLNTNMFYRLQLP